jgi:hypothetical protein
MEAFLLLQQRTWKDLHPLNLCCLGPNVKLLSEICNPKGDNMLPEILQGQRQRELKSTMSWPKQARRFEKLWISWREALKHAHLSPESLSATKARISLPLNVPLGAWIGSQHRSQHTWNSHVSPDNAVLCQSRMVGCQLHNDTKGIFWNHRFQLDCFSALPDLSSVTCIIPVSVAPTIRSLASSQLPRPATVVDNSVMVHPAVIVTICNHLETLDELKRSLLEPLECISGKNRLREIQSSGDLIKFTLASDGGTRDDLGSFAWEVAVDCKSLWECKGPAFGLQPGSFQAKSCGFLSALLFMQAHVQHFNTIIDQNVNCDSKSLLLRIQCLLHRPWVNSTQCLASDFDLESGILDLVVSLSLSFQCPNVKSHQDDNTKVHLLPWEKAQMNVHADALATDCLDNHAEPSKIAPFIPASRASVPINGKPSLDDMQNNSNKQLAAPEHARDSWLGALGLSTRFNPSPGTHLRRHLKLQRTVTRSSSSNLCTTVCLLDHTCTGSNGPKPTNAPPVNTLSKPIGMFSAVQNVHHGVKCFFAPWVTPWLTCTGSLTFLALMLIQGI